MNNLTLRTIWMTIGVLLISVAVLQLIRLGNDIWSGAGASLVLLFGFALILVTSASKQNVSRPAHRLFVVCLMVLVVYSLAYVLMVGWEFGLAWLTVDLAALSFSLFTVFRLKGKWEQTSNNPEHSGTDHE